MVIYGGRYEMIPGLFVLHIEKGTSATKRIQQLIGLT